MIGKDGAFFFPDFVTENFEPIKVFKKFTAWFTKIGGSLSKNSENCLKKKLPQSKKHSNSLKTNRKKRGNPKGYETILIEFLVNKYPKIIMNAYPSIKKVSNNHQYPDKNKFEPIFKKIFTENYLLEIIKDSLENDPKRKGRKFSFEIKLKPFYESINKYMYRNDVIQYDLDI